MMQLDEFVRLVGEAFTIRQEKFALEGTVIRAAGIPLEDYESEKAFMEWYRTGEEEQGVFSKSTFGIIGGPNMFLHALKGK